MWRWDSEWTCPVVSIPQGGGRQEEHQNRALRSQEDTGERDEICSEKEGTSLVVQWLRIRLPMQGTGVRSLVGELRSHRPWGN